MLGDDARSCISPLSPQHSRTPGCAAETYSIAQVCRLPADTMLADPRPRVSVASVAWIVVLSPICPYKFHPQHTSMALHTAQL